MNEKKKKMVDSITEDIGRLSSIYKHNMIGLCQALQIEHASSGNSLSLARIKALIFLAKQGESPVGDVANALGISLPTASQILDRMVQNDLVARKTNPGDRRQVLVSLLPQAIELAAQLEAARRRQVEIALAGLPRDEWSAAARGLRLLTDALEATDINGIVETLSDSPR